MSEGFVRPTITIADVDALYLQLRDLLTNHLGTVGDGSFMHPHEIVGCMHGQLHKLSVAADATLYSDNLDDFEERCMKTLLAIMCGAASVEKLRDLRELAAEKIRELGGT